MLGRGAFQEMDYRAFFGSVAKWATEIETAAQIPEVIQRAFHIAMQGRPGPVVIALPEDMLTGNGRGRPTRRAPRRRRSGRASTQMAELQKMLWAAERPIAILGGPGWTERASAAFARFAERFDLPVAGSFRRASAFDGEHDNYAGEIGLSANPEAEGADRERRSRVAGRRPHVGGGRRRAIRCSTFPRRASGSSTSTPTRTRSAATIIRRSAIIATSPAFCAALEGVQPPAAIPWAAETRAGARRLSRLERAGAGQSGPRAAERDHVRAAPPRSRRHLHHRRRQLRDLGRPLPALPRGSSSRSGRPRARWASACRRRSPPSGCFPSALSSASPATAIS